MSYGVIQPSPMLIRSSHIKSLSMAEAIIYMILNPEFAFPTLPTHQTNVHHIIRLRWLSAILENLSMLKHWRYQSMDSVFLSIFILRYSYGWQRWTHIAHAPSADLPTSSRRHLLGEIRGSAHGTPVKQHQTELSKLPWIFPGAHCSRKYPG